MLHVLTDIWSVDAYSNICIILYSGWRCDLARVICWSRSILHRFQNFSTPSHFPELLSGGILGRDLFLKNHVNFFRLSPPAAVESLFGIEKQRLWFIWGLLLFYSVLKRDEHEVSKPLQWLESAWTWSPELAYCAANIYFSPALSVRVILYAVLKTVHGGVARGFQCEPSLPTSCFFWLISTKLSVLFC